MELIQVNSQKLKIILTKDDMQSFDITNEDLDYSSSKTRKALGDILEKAKNETGFDTGNDRLYIQVFPSVDGGCEMFLTKRARLLPEPERSERSYLRRKYGSAFDYKRECGKYIAKSENLEDIIKLCLRLKKEKFCGRSSFYLLDGSYILNLDFRRASPSFTKIQYYDDDMSRFSFMCDYCFVRYADELPLVFIKEHGKQLIGNTAVETICEKFGED